MDITKFTVDSKADPAEHDLVFLSDQEICFHIGR